MNINREGADYGYHYDTSEAVFFLKVFLAGKLDFISQTIVINECLLGLKYLKY